MNVANVLLIMKDKRIRQILKLQLERKNFLIEDSENLVDVLKNPSDRVDLIITDVIELNTDYMEMVENSSTPIVLLTEKDSEFEFVKKLEAKNVSYIIKPYSPREVIVKALSLLESIELSRMKRISSSDVGIYVTNSFTLYPGRHSVVVDEQEILFTQKEFELLQFLTNNPGIDIDRDLLMNAVWNKEFYSDLRTVDTHIRRVREKLKMVSPTAAEMIVTAWGVGYRFEVKQNVPV